MLDIPRLKTQFFQVEFDTAVRTRTYLFYI